MNNPQYRLVVHDANASKTTTQKKSSLPSPSTHAPSAKVPVRMTVEGDRNLPVNVVVAWNKGERVDEYVYLNVFLSKDWYLCW